MPLDKLIVFQGKGTMTGDATESKLPSSEYVEGHSFDSILEDLRREDALAVLPIWNSHLGEIKKTKIIECLFEEGFFVHAIWPHWIDFACIVRKGTREEDIKRIISFFVASVQCSDFIEERNAEFDDDSSTSTKNAHHKFTEISKWDAVLCSAELCNESQEIIRENVSNKLNFTSFVLIGKVQENEWIGAQWDKLKQYILPKVYQISGIEMPAIEGSLSEEQHELFENLLQDVSHIDEIPKIIFASEQEYAKIRLILEYKKVSLRDYFPEVGLLSDILVLNDIGSTKLFYSEEIKRFIPLRHDNFLQKHFVKHVAQQACFYSCPPLNIFVHGFDVDITELIARESIVNHFRALERGIDCTETQKDFFERYKDDYREYGIEFPAFEEL